MKVAIGYLTVAGLWTWAGLWWVLSSGKSPFTHYPQIYVCGAGVAGLCFVSAFLMYIRSKVSILLIAAIPIAQWFAFKPMFPERFVFSEFETASDYFRQLPPALQFDIIFYIVLIIYALFLWKHRRLT